MQGQYGVTEDTVLLIAGPAYHAAPMDGPGLPGHRGHRGPARALRCRGVPGGHCAHGVTHALFVPTHFVRMLNLPEAVRARYDVSSLRRVVHSAAACPPHVKRAMIEWFGPIIDEYYSATEAAGFTVVDSETWLRKPGTVRHPLGGVPHILDEDGRELPVGETGAVYFEGVDSFEYHGDPGRRASSSTTAAGAATATWAGSTRTAISSWPIGGATLIISGGVNIYPQESENVLSRSVGGRRRQIGDRRRVRGRGQGGGRTPPRGRQGNDELAEALLAFCRATRRIKCPSISWGITPHADGQGAQTHIRQQLGRGPAPADRLRTQATTRP